MSKKIFLQKEMNFEENLRVPYVEFKNQISSNIARYVIWFICLYICIVHLPSNTHPTDILRGTPMGSLSQTRS